MAVLRIKIAATAAAGEKREKKNFYFSNAQRARMECVEFENRKRGAEAIIASVRCACATVHSNLIFSFLFNAFSSFLERWLAAVATRDSLRRR